MASANTKTTIKLATLTAAAKNDSFSYDEDSLQDGNTLVLNVLANDPGAARLYSVWQPASEPAGTTPATSSQLPILNSVELSSGATITMNLDGTVSYVAGSGFDYLQEGESATDTFSYTVRMANGALSTATVTVNITGTNDLASISGDTEGSVTEDGTLTTGGTLTVSDLDHDQSSFQQVDDAALTGTYGGFTFDSNTGEWDFIGNNGAETQSLWEDEEAVQTFVVKSLDGTDEETITVTIKGMNDLAIFEGADDGSVTEDGTQTTGGTLTVNDKDHDQSGFKPVEDAALAGEYGNFTFDSNTGAWTYILNNTAGNVQSLIGGQTVDDTLTVESLDGTTKEIVVTINGVDEEVLLPPDEENIGEGATGQEFTVNNGQSFQNGQYIIDDYNEGDYITSAGYQYSGEWNLIDHIAGDNNTEDSISASFEKTGGGKNTSQTGNGDVDVILVGYTGAFTVNGVEYNGD